jgi:hypothetical protein
MADRKFGLVEAGYQIGGTNFLPTALFADHVDEVRGTQADLLVEAELIQLPKVITDHGETPFSNTDRQGTTP